MSNNDEQQWRNTMFKEKLLFNSAGYLVGKIEYRYHLNMFRVISYYEVLNDNEVLYSGNSEAHAETVGDNLIRRTL